MRSQLDWDAPLRYRRGAQQRLRGIDVYHDFPWGRHFPDRRAQFVNGQCLADQVIEDCPADKRPALLLTDRDDVDEGARETERAYVMVVNLPRYLENAEGNAARAYLAQRLGRGITRAKRFSEVGEVVADELAWALGDRLDAEVLRSWAGENEERLELLRTIGTPEHGEAEGDERSSDLERALAALEALEGLDPQITEAIVALVMTETDIAARAELLWALTVLESHPWLLGLDYAQIRPRQPIPRGAVDFLLERFDGFHDLLELKSPTDAIFETHGKDTPIRSPSSYRLSRPLALALAQVHAYRHALSYEDAVEDLYRLPFSRESRITILIGQASGLTEHQERLLRELNRSLHRVEIVPFDVLGRRARAVLDNVERYLLAADEEAGGE